MKKILAVDDHMHIVRLIEVNLGKEFAVVTAGDLKIDLGSRVVTRTGVPVRTGRFMTTRLIALVEHPAADERSRVEVTTRRRIAGGPQPR